MPVVSGNNIEDGVYIAIAPILVADNTYLSNVLIQIGTDGESRTCNYLLGTGTKRDGWYYINDEFKDDVMFGNWDITVKARNINKALRTNFVGIYNVRISSNQLTHELIKGKLKPIEGNGDLNNLNVIEDELTDI